MRKIQEFNAKVRASLKRPELKAGDIVKIHRKIKEGEKERIQIFEGIVIGVKGKQSSSPMVTIRRVSLGTGVELTLPLYSPAISKIEIIKQAKVRRAKLYYLRKKGLRLSKLKTKELSQFAAEEEKEETITEKADQPKEEMAAKKEKKAVEAPADTPTSTDKKFLAEKEKK